MTFAARTSVHQADTTWPLGVTLRHGGAHFAVAAPLASAVLLCLVDDDGAERRFPMRASGGVWHSDVVGVRPGQRYGYRVEGEWDPRKGLRFNPTKILVDPYARAITGDVTWDASVFGFSLDEEALRDRVYMLTPQDALEITPDAGWAISSYDSLGQVPLSVVVDSTFDWGYNTLGFFAPHATYSSSGSLGEQVHEFKTMVEELHRNGIEVILDVVYNHTAETHRLGPQLSMRGLANQEYYHLDPNAPHEYVDFTGTGNSLNLEAPLTQQLLLDSLAYWVDEMHVDGFRFDLAPVLARSNGYWRWDSQPRPRQIDVQDSINLRSDFMKRLESHPSLARTKLFAEPWDVGPDGYQLGNFSPRWAEWNGKFRDDVRDFWRGRSAMVGPLASRVAGSADVFQAPGARPTNSVNFVTNHDGFTLRDLVTYEIKKNEANGEHNRDGANDNRSMNFGVEGTSTVPAIEAARLRQRKNHFLTLMVSQGIPLISLGDELGRTQGGNNNAYCHDIPVSWIDWSASEPEFWNFARQAVRARTAFAALRRRRFFEGTATDAVDGDLQPDVVWLDRDGAAMDSADWDDEWQRSIVFVLNGSSESCGLTGSTRDVLVMLNASTEPVTYQAPPESAGRSWELILSSAEPHEFGDFPGESWNGLTVTVPPRSATLFAGIVR
ncbi:alpha-amylase family glycosyl hydrolase [Neomicrococcus lactis]|uniref:Glycogen operon protein n=1 Tax=Neomicrococcus lactis TaxID=732241 RepID=A0A7W8Y8W7_9MICC|nr:glycogen operon protein [Neomicrococcus lactis]